MANGVLIKVDKATLDRFKDLAGGSPVARYLRELSINLSGGTPAPLSPIEKKLNSIDERLRNIERGKKG
jgi:hypothetical protein